MGARLNRYLHECKRSSTGYDKGTDLSGRPLVKMSAAGSAFLIALAPSGAGNRLVFNPVRLHGFGAKTGFFVFLISLIVTFEPFDMAFTFEREDMRSDPVKEPSVVGNDHGAAWRIPAEPLQERAMCLHRDRSSAHRALAD